MPKLTIKEIRELKVNDIIVIKYWDYFGKVKIIHNDGKTFNFKFLERLKQDVMCLFWKDLDLVSVFDGDPGIEYYLYIPKTKYEYINA